MLAKRVETLDAVATTTIMSSEPAHLTRQLSNDGRGAPSHRNKVRLPAAPKAMAEEPSADRARVAPRRNATIGPIEEVGARRKHRLGSPVRGEARTARPGRRRRDLNIRHSSATSCRATSCARAFDQDEMKRIEDAYEGSAVQDLARSRGAA